MCDYKTLECVLACEIQMGYSHHNYQITLYCKSVLNNVEVRAEKIANGYN